MWRSICAARQQAVQPGIKRPFIGRQSQRITFLQGRGEIGVENQGLNRWGMNFRRREAL